MSEIPTTARELVNSRSLGLCERCAGSGTEVHHRKRGHPRDHSVQNLLRLCHTCHRFVTVYPLEGRRTGFDLITRYDAYWTPFVLSGLVWAWPTPQGGYFIERPMRDMGEVYQALKRQGLSRSDGRLALADAMAVNSGSLDHSPFRPAEGDGSLGDSVVEVGIPALFRYRPGEGLAHFFARLREQPETVDRVAQVIEPLVKYI